ncbi:hypothetical protein FN846DRAFT_431467 [Sphaerosporella brunnea]|uniref:LCCL domain-containing protein n=1 Tax=Sphaerosporella brunnea TaxID=1250544 RepID=A0A5J5EGR1_9PEZI|nr:hypothetical protein FN846DRAFT_431467 [Sphaerosporella brunnea]
MAAPKEMTTKDFSGKFCMNKALSDDTDDVLYLQNVGWVTRKAIQLASITLDIKHYTSPEDHKEHIDIVQTLTGGIKGTTELRTLDWQERSHSDHIFGNIVGKSRRLGLEDVEDEFLKTGWLLEEGSEASFVESFVVSGEHGWTAQQIWGFEEIDDEKKYVRHLKFTKGSDKVLTKKLVYDYIGPAP